MGRDIFITRKEFTGTIYGQIEETDKNGVIDPKGNDTDDINDTKVEPNDETILSIFRINPKATQKDIGI